MAELITVQKYWKRWADPRWIVCVFNNQDLNEVTWEQRVIPDALFFFLRPAGLGPLTSTRVSTPFRDCEFRALVFRAKCR